MRRKFYINNDNFFVAFVENVYEKEDAWTLALYEWKIIMEKKCPVVIFLHKHTSEIWAIETHKIDANNTENLNYNGIDDDRIIIDRYFCKYIPA
jgi:hypothetical protein